MKKSKILALIVCFLSFLLIVSLLKNIFNLLKAQERLKKSREELEQLKTENFNLLEKEKYVQGNYFFEKQVRDKLNMAKEGETIVLLPSLPPKPKREKGKAEITQETAIWRQWLNLF